MLTYNDISCKKNALEKIVQDFSKDLLSIKCVPHNEHAAQIILEIITYNDVFLPLTDTCFVNISSAGSCNIVDPYNVHLKNADKYRHENLVRSITMNIMKCILQD